MWEIRSAARTSDSKPEYEGSSPSSLAILRKCPRCHGIFDEEHFGTRTRSGRKVRQAYCPGCTKWYRREHYRDNPEPYKRRAEKTRNAVKEAARAFIRGYLRSHPCVDCGTTDVRVLQFDHVRGKKVGRVGNMLSRSIKVISEEIAKCEVRCANCHTIVTGIRAGVWWTKESS